MTNKIENLTNLSIKIPSESFEKLRNDKTFVTMIRLTRFVNQVTFCWTAYSDNKDSDSPVSRRQSLNAILFVSGVLFEFLDKFYGVLSEEFRHYASFKEFDNLNRDPNNKLLKRDHLRKLRNSVVYHVDEEPYTSLLNGFTLPEYKFLDHSGNSIFQSYFDLTDNLTIYHIIGNLEDDELEKKLFSDFLGRMTNLTVAFLKASSNLFYEYAHKMNWEITIDGERVTYNQQSK